jgi:16S rRNA (guanine527-N7)-methyltransferase
MLREKPEKSLKSLASADAKKKLLASGARRLGVSLDRLMVDAFVSFLDELIRWNQRMNLTSVRDERAIIVRHFLDSLSLVRYLPKTASLVDIGSGAGFPGIPLKIAIPDLRVVLLEAARKKTYFHRRVIRSLGLLGIESVWGRSDRPEIREVLGGRFDLVVSRAVSSLDVFLQEGIHFVRPGGTIIAMGGSDVDKRNLPVPPDVTLCRTIPIELPLDRIKRHLLFFKITGTRS